jgi:hypothetical protein
VFVGDRIAPQQLATGYGLIIFDYTDRRPGEAMATPPSLAKTKFLAWKGADLVDIPLAADQSVAAGEVVIGHEVRSFFPCGTDRPSWLAGDSPPCRRSGRHNAWPSPMRPRTPPCSWF